MHLLYESPVTVDQIDSLGHLNVRFYLTRVDQACRRLFTDAGIAALLATEAATLRRVDTYSRFMREQFEGAQLGVYGGLLEVSEDEIRCYFEIRNRERDELAALFITGSALIERRSEARRPIPPGIPRVHEMFGVRLPEYATPRSLSLDPPRLDISLQELERRIPEDPPPGLMSGRREGVILPEDCDADGRVREDIELMFILHRRAMESAPDGADGMGPPVLRTEDGHRMSWAMMETRSVVFSRPRLGDEIVFLGADVGLAEKSRRSRRWAFVKGTGELVSVHDSVGVAIDLDARRAVPIPADIRAAIEASYRPELA